jgi:signal transduction histidine kinase
MKLLSKTSLLIITASIFIFWIGNIVFFIVSKEMISQHINSELMSQMIVVKSQIGSAETDKLNLNLNDLVSIREVAPDDFQPPLLSDTVLFSSTQAKYIPHRALKFTFTADEINHEVIIFKSLLSSDNLIQRITISSIIQLIVFILMIYILNRYIFSNVWSIFSSSMGRVEDYDIKSREKLTLPRSEIDEFEKLNSVLLEMVDRIQTDYLSLKELTANTSHEIQTPLAIINNKAEILLQSESLTEADMEIVDSIISTTARLSKLNQSLLLITKIENHQFEESEDIDMAEALEKYLDGLEALVNEGRYKIVSSLKGGLVRINPVLLDVLVSNLLKNAIMHGTKGGDINLSYNDNILVVSNTGEPFGFESERLFERFFKGSNKQGSSGLGLEIVRKICNYYRIDVAHSYLEGRHSFRIDFSKISPKGRG